MDDSHLGFAGRMARTFSDSQLTPLIVVASVLLGLAATWSLPREEEPQIKVPMIDVMVAMPGATPEEVEQRVTRPMEKLLWEIPDVEYIYSTSMPGQSLVIVRYEVGTEMEVALVRLEQKLRANFDRIPEGVSRPLIKARSIDDVPILALTFHGGGYGGLALRRLVAQVDEHVKEVENVAETMIIGGRQRALRVLVDPARLEARGMALDQLEGWLASQNRRYYSGSLDEDNREVLVEVGAFLERPEDFGALVIGAGPDGGVVYLRDVAQVRLEAQEPESVVYHASGDRSEVEEAVTLTVAKRPGANAIHVVEEVMAKVEQLRGYLIPADVEVTVTRDYGETAKEKSDELLLHMGIAVVSVSLLIAFFLGWREALVVLIAIPATLGLTLAVFYLYGYTLNRITLFALIFSIGILVDDAIVVVENLARHIRLPESERKDLRQVVIESVAEVGNPTVLATWAVVAAILPMAFVGGLMGPYMRPIPIGASAAMIFSLLVAFVVTPWAAKRVMFWRRSREAVARAHEHEGEGWMTRAYRWFMTRLLHSMLWRSAFFVTIVVLLLGSMAFVPLGWVQVKMLPFDNKSEYQVIVDMPEGSTMEKTAAVGREMLHALREMPETSNVQLYVSAAAPYNFNGLVRHYFLRQENHQADLQVNLLPKHDRSEQSHDIAKRARPIVQEIADGHGATVSVAEVPPGPPVLQTLVAEVYGPTPESRLALAEEVKAILDSIDGVVDLDWRVEAPQPKARLRVDGQKAGQLGLSVDAVHRLLSTALEGRRVGLLHDEALREDVPVTLEWAAEDREDVEELLALKLQGRGGPVALREIVWLEETERERNRYHKNMQPVIYVTADVAGEIESPAYALFAANEKLKELDARQFGGDEARLKIYNAYQPDNSIEPSMKWDGEWHITLEVFRDLGLAFAAVLILIYGLMVGWFKSFLTPLIVMVAIPFSLVGILPAHAAMGAFFTATSMIGFMAGAGIVVRNSIILVDFIELRLKQGDPLDKAVEDAGAVRFRPMLLTALAVVVAASVILADPIFQGLAISLMAGEVASLLISRMAVPVLYYVFGDRETADEIEEG